MPPPHTSRAQDWFSGSAVIWGHGLGPSSISRSLELFNEPLLLLILYFLLYFHLPSFSFWYPLPFCMISWDISSTSPCTYIYMYVWSISVSFQGLYQKNKIKFLFSLSKIPLYLLDFLLVASSPCSDIYCRGRELVGSL